MTVAASTQILSQRWQHSKTRLAQAGFDAVVICGGFDMFYLTGYSASSYERITAFVTAVETNSSTKPSLVIPELEVALLDRSARELLTLEPWQDHDDPLDIIAAQLKNCSNVVVSDELWSQFLLGLQQRLPNTKFSCLSDAIGGLRSIKSADEMAALIEIGNAASSVATRLQEGEFQLIGRTEAEVAQDISTALLETGHSTVEFCIVASGPNSASPHHEPGSRIIEVDEMLLLDFGGRSEKGYCSDITRCLWTGSTVPTDVADIYQVLKEAQQCAVEVCRAGATLGSVDAAARNIIETAGFGDAFIHRTGHGIGTQVHEQPWVKAGNDELIQVGHSFSVEPGIYLDGKWGIRLEDIVVIEADGPVRCSNALHDLVAIG